MQVVVFLDKTARVITHPENPHEYENNPNAVINPDLTLVHGLAPHFWKKEFGRIVPMTDHERADRLKELEYDKSNTYSINEMFLRVSHLQNNIEELNKEITRLNDQIIDQAKDHEKATLSLKEAHLVELMESDDRWSKHLAKQWSEYLETMAKTKEELRSRYYKMMIAAIGLSIILTYAVMKLFKS